MPTPLYGTPKFPNPTKSQAARVFVMEYERGWGSRVDDILYFASVEDADAYCKDYNAGNTAEVVPDWYMTAVRG